MRTKREFVAIGLSNSVRSCLADWRDDSIAGVHWVPQENFHITMRFLGDVGDEESGLRDQLRRIRVAPFTLEVGDLGAFPPKGQAKVIWVGLGSGHPLLFQLRQKIDNAILSAGIDVELRDFIPHITLGRCSGVSRETIKRFSASRQGQDGFVFKVTEFALFESRPSPSGVRYFPVETFSLIRDKSHGLVT